MYTCQSMFTTPLFEAIKLPNESAVEVLLQNGADPYQIVVTHDDNEWRPCSYNSFLWAIICASRQHGYTIIIDIFLNYDEANLVEGLFITIERGYEWILSYLLDKLPDAKATIYENALVELACLTFTGDFTILYTLISRGACISSSKILAHALCCRHSPMDGNQELVQYLIKHGARNTLTNFITNTQLVDIHPSKKDPCFTLKKGNTSSRIRGDRVRGVIDGLCLIDDRGWRSDQSTCSEDDFQPNYCPAKSTSKKFRRRRRAIRQAGYVVIEFVGLLMGCVS
eukprot:TRINITY_DN1269_c7_g1_i1.p1 TRINITY_DN1269_c7_g1~~TRINITY_DN1269_c7_g1_i1.p1  ORF type:complete len:283 (+),score=7.90 TRINITY_DN1269_c7_g1_i1:50-898(+)